MRFPLALSLFLVIPLLLLLLFRVVISLAASSLEHLHNAQTTAVTSIKPDLPILSLFFVLVGLRLCCWNSTLRLSLAAWSTNTHPRGLTAHYYYYYYYFRV